MILRGAAVINPDRVTPVISSVLYNNGGVPEWSKGTDCKSVGDAFGGSNPPPTTILGNKLYVGDFRINIYRGRYLNYITSCIRLATLFREILAIPAASMRLFKLKESVFGLSGSSSVGRASAFQAGCREFESRLPLHCTVQCPDF